MQSTSKIQNRNKILIIKLGALGDLIIATPLIDAIAKNHKKAEIFILTRKEHSSFFTKNHDVSIITINNSSLRTFVSIAFQLRKNLWEKIYDLQGNDRSRALVFFCNAKCKIGNHRFPNNFYLKEKWTRQTHIFYRMKNLLELEGIKHIQETPLIKYGKNEVNKVDKWIASHILQGKFVILHAGSSKSRTEKRWPYFENLAVKLHSAGYEIIWVGGNEEAELNSRLSDKVGINSTGLFNIHELAYIGRHASFAITNDSAPMHILSSSNIPVFGIFGPTDENLHYAVGNKSRVISTDNPLTKISSISVNKVWNKLKEEKLVG